MFVFASSADQKGCRKGKAASAFQLTRRCTGSCTLLEPLLFLVQGIDFKCWKEPLHCLLAVQQRGEGLKWKEQERRVKFVYTAEADLLGNKREGQVNSRNKSAERRLDSKSSPTRTSFLWPSCLEQEGNKQSTLDSNYLQR